MSQLQERIEKICAVKRSVDDVIWPATDLASLDRLRAYIRAMFQLELPQSYVELVSRTDGLEFNSMMIFGVNAHKSPYLSSVEEINEVLVDIPRRRAYFGGTGDDLFAYCLEDKTWRILDRATLSPLEDFADFNSLFLHVLDEAYECFAD